MQHSAPVYPLADEQRVRAESAAWATFTAPADADAFYAGWLALLAARVGRARAALLLTRDDEAPTFVVAAAWPDPRRDLQYLGAVARQALERREGVVTAPDGEDPPRPTSRRTSATRSRSPARSGARSCSTSLPARAPSCRRRCARSTGPAAGCSIISADACSRGARRTSRAARSSTSCSRRRCSTRSRAVGAGGRQRTGVPAALRPRLRRLRTRRPGRAAGDVAHRDLRPAFRPGALARRGDGRGDRPRRRGRPSGTRRRRAGRPRARRKRAPARHRDDAVGAAAPRGPGGRRADLRAQRGAGLRRDRTCASPRRSA